MAFEPLKVISCDLRKEKNEDVHHTNEYDTDSTRLVVRRGQPFHLRLTFNHEKQYPDDAVIFELRIGRRPRTTNKSRIILDLVEKKPGENVVGVRYSNVVSDVLDLEVMTPVDMGIGQWMLMMYSRSPKSRSRSQTSVVSDDIVMLFNPWVKGDQVYMENEKWRKEYVLNEDGRLYCGSKTWIGGMDWFFGQFEREVLDVCLKLLNGLTYADRSDVTQVARHMSALVNDADDNGVLEGRWGGSYADGTEPTDWVGSYAILKKYWETGKTVKYGQCWVFSGVLCTVLRCLGIPARSLTNFESAHDTDSNLTIDYHYDEKGDSLDNDDSIWNFHVWNDAWMSRPDLEMGYGGWQALDATPQETSRGKYRCGPMPLSAIKQGHLDKKYDGLFIYAEVNGTMRHWRVSKDGVYTELYSNSSQIGQRISTKAVDSDERVDITNQYKFAEGSPEEKISFKTARKYAKFIRVEKKEEPTLVRIDTDIPVEVLIGKDITATFKFTNTSKAPQDVFLAVIGKVMQYNGSIVAKIHDVDIKEHILAGKSKEVTTTISAKTYLSKVKNNNSIKFFVLGGVKGPESMPKQTFAHHDSVELMKPVMELKPSQATTQVGKTLHVTASFKNPLTTALQPGVLRIEGSGTMGVMELAVKQIKGNATFSQTFTITPRRIGKKKVIVGYASPSLSGVQGSLSLTVDKAK